MWQGVGATSGITKAVEADCLNDLGSLTNVTGTSPTFHETLFLA